MRLNNTGQTSVEYLLLIIVMVTILVSVVGIIRRNVLSGAGNCTAGNKSMVCQFERMYGGENFKYFNLSR